MLNDSIAGQQLEFYLLAIEWDAIFLDLEVRLIQTVYCFTAVGYRCENRYLRGRGTGHGDGLEFQTAQQAATGSEEAKNRKQSDAEASTHDAF